MVTRKCAYWLLVLAVMLWGTVCLATPGQKIVTPGAWMDGFNKAPGDPMDPIGQWGQLNWFNFGTKGDFDGAGHWRFSGSGFNDLDHNVGSADFTGTVELTNISFKTSTNPSGSVDASTFEYKILEFPDAANDWSRALQVQAIAISQDIAQPGLVSDYVLFVNTVQNNSVNIRTVVPLGLDTTSLALRINWQDTFGLGGNWTVDYQKNGGVWTNAISLTAADYPTEPTMSRIAQIFMFGNQPSTYFIDKYTFVPEPITMLFLGAGGLMLTRRKRS
jgi:hypothetical protein